MRPDTQQSGMAATQRQPFGMHHVTVVPTNFEPAVDDDSADEEE